MNYDIRDFGAVPYIRVPQTDKIQTAIDTCSCEGGGKVVVGGGWYYVGTIVLKPNVELHLKSDGILLASADHKDFPERENVKHVNSQKLPRHQNSCIIFAEKCENISITGTGAIDCNGEAFIEKAADFWMPYKRIDAPTPARCVFLTGCKNVRISNVTMRNQPAGWAYWIHDCDHVSFDNVMIDSRVDFPNNDGIHINSSRNVTISNSVITCGDDCIVVRANNSSLADNKVCEKVVVTNCTLTTWCNGIRIGWLNDGVIKNCTFSNIVITDSQIGIGIVLPTRDDTPLADEGREKTLIENISFSNIIMDRCGCTPMMLSIGDCEYTGCNAVRNLYFNNVHARCAEFPFIRGRKSDYLKNLYFSDCTFEKQPLESDDPKKKYGACAEMLYGKDNNNSFEIHYAENVHFNNTAFSANE